MSPTRVAFLVSLLAGLAAVSFSPRRSLAPGELGPGHAQAACPDCHSPWRGVTVAACLACHPRDDPGPRLDAGSPLRALHAEVEGCAGCHLEHGGTHQATFRHGALPQATQQACASCHPAPRDAVHAAAQACVACHGTATWKGAKVDHARLAGQACESCHAAPKDEAHAQARGCVGCHGTQTWKGAKVDHARLTGQACASCHPAPKDAVHAEAGACAACHGTQTWKGAKVDHARLAGQACDGCHARQRPADALHAGGAGCERCHSTSAWRPASFEHSKFFALDRDHDVPCAQCHTTQGNFKAYDCTTCHEHSPAQLAHEHDEEGLSGKDLRDCVRCHRSADGEGEHGGGEREHEGGEREREHDDDD